MNTIRLSFLFASFVFFASEIAGFKVLGVLPFGSHSHFAIGNGILKSLAKAGHEVTVISPFPLKKPMENYHDVDFSDLLQNFKEGSLLCVQKVQRLIKNVLQSKYLIRSL
jgi:hypothetical protein